MVSIRVVLHTNNSHKCEDTARLLEALEKFEMPYFVEFENSDRANRWKTEADFGDRKKAGCAPMYVVGDDDHATWGASEPSVEVVDEGIDERNMQIAKAVLKPSLPASA